MSKHRKHAIHHANHSAANAQFIAQAATAAVQCEIATGTPAAITIAQAVLESGWGRHHIGSANNYFGVKAQKKGDNVSWGGIATGYVDVNTREHFNGKDVTISQPFRSYSTMGDSFTDHGQFLANNGRYRQYLQDYAGNGDARALHAACRRRAMRPTPNTRNC
jgi:flagellum-specific peptidoglycan hydrolase FlgJ